MYTKIEFHLFAAVYFYTTIGEVLIVFFLVIILKVFIHNFEEQVKAVQLEPRLGQPHKHVGEDQRYQCQ
jgi:hypothetical protein